MEIQAKVRASAAVPASKDKDGKEIAAQPAKPERVTKANYDMPADLDGAIKSYGKDVVWAAAKGAIVISIQALMRRCIDAGKSQADIQKEVSAFKPDVRNVVKQSAFEKASKSLSQLTPEERKKLLADLQAMK